MRIYKNGTRLNFPISADRFLSRVINLIIMKKHLAKFIFIFSMILGLAISASAQQDDKEKQEPKRPKPPTIVVPKKPKPPKDEEKKKKPDQTAQFIINKEYADLS